MRGEAKGEGGKGKGDHDALQGTGRQGVRAEAPSPFPFRLSPSYDLAALRAAEFPWTSTTTYLNHASIGPLPERTRRVLDEFNRRRGMPYLLPDREMFGILTESRRLAAALIGAEPEEIGLTVNTSFGLGLAARALPFRPGDVVLVSDREFPANVYPWMRLEDRGVRLELVPTDSAGWPDEARMLERLRDPRVRCVAVSQVQFSSGYAVDLPRLSAATRETGAWLVVDAIQAIGQVPLDVGQVEVDVLACGGQKWLLSPWGTGFVYVRRELIASFDPAITGWLAFENTDDLTRLTSYDPTLRPDARRFELMTLPYQDFAGFNPSVGLLLELGIERIAEHLRGLHRPVVDWADAAGVPVTSPRDGRGSGILCVAPDRVAEAHRRLKAERIICSLREGSIRLSPHCYTTLAEMERVAEVLGAG